MKKIILEQGGGKTDQLIAMSADSGAYIVCLSEREAARIQSRAKELEFKIPFPITFHEFLGGQYHPSGIKNGFLIDNADLLIQSLTPVTVKAITMRP